MKYLHSSHFRHSEDTRVTKPPLGASQSRALWTRILYNHIDTLMVWSFLPVATICFRISLSRQGERHGTMAPRERMKSPHWSRRWITSLKNHDSIFFGRAPQESLDRRKIFVYAIKKGITI